jgi:hypothetical protein
MAELVLKDEVYQIIGAAMDVYYQLGRGFLETQHPIGLLINFGSAVRLEWKRYVLG